MAKSRKGHGHEDARQGATRCLPSADPRWLTGLLAENGRMATAEEAATGLQKQSTQKHAQAESSVSRVDALAALAHPAYPDPDWAPDINTRPLPKT
jgi:hypothetical protein